MNAVRERGWGGRRERGRAGLATAPPPHSIEAFTAEAHVIQTGACSELYPALPSVWTLREAAMAKTRRVIRRKNMLIDQRKLDAAKAALGAETETAAVDAALDLVVFRAEVFRGLDALVAAGGLEAPTRRAG